MCGISGFFDRNFRLDQKQLEKYNSVLAHRGPDGNGVFFKKGIHSNIGFAHTRLSILDLSALGQQPMYFEHLTIILNGEIYNFQNIQKELLDLGYTFSSTSDTEVVLKSFHAWGINCVERFRGMFSFAIYNNEKEKVYLCRDRVGVKPLYYSTDNNQLIFGSELKIFFNTENFSPHIDHDSLATFINFGYSTNTSTILKNLRKAAPGTWSIYDCSTGKMKNSSYWNYGEQLEKPRFTGSFNDAVIETERLAQEACELRMVSDVPVGIFLSGGFDSTFVTALLQKDRETKLNTFTIGFSDGVDESKDAQVIAAHLKTDHTSYDCKQQDAMDLLPQLPFLYDDPLADISCIPTMLVSKLASQEVSVALSADGGDELFGGYNGFKSAPNLLSRLGRVPLQRVSGHVAVATAGLFTGEHAHIHKKLKGVGNILLSHDKDKFSQMHKQQYGLPEEMLNNLFIAPYSIKHHKHIGRNLHDPLDDLYILGVEDTMTNLLLPKVDRGAMGFSLEGREPLLDHVLMEFAATLPYSYKHDGIHSKRPIREIVYKYVPKEIMDRPKVGFDLPIFKWLRKDLSFLIDQYLNAITIKKGGLFNADYVQKIVGQFRNGTLRYEAIIWRLLVFQMWYERWMEKENI